MQKNKDKVALIAGIENQVGATAAAKLMDSGWSVLGVDILPEDELKMAKKFDEYYSLDMTNREKFKDAVTKMEANYGAIKVLFCTTGFEIDRQSGTFLETSIEQWGKTLDGWLRSSINACAAVGPSMVNRKEGKIMILSPDFSKINEENILNATGAGTLHGFAKSFGVEVAKDNVLVNCIYANLPFDNEAIAANVQFLADSGNYVSAQVISVRGKDKEVRA